MFLILSFVAFLVLHAANAQACYPEPVQNITLDMDSILHWVPSKNCEGTSHMVFIGVAEDDLKYTYFTYDDYLNVSFLGACVQIYFKVRPICCSNVIGDPRDIITYLPAPSGADLTITSFTASEQDGGTFLNWFVTPHYAHCAKAFRLVIYDAYNPLPRDIYTDRNHLFLNGLIPCAEYQLGLAAIYNLEEEGPVNLIRYTAKEENSPPPVLEKLIVGDTFADVIWSMPSYSVNRCKINSLVIDSLPHFHRLFPIADRAERPPATTNLTSLEPDSMYMLKVTIENSVGSSEVLTIGVQTQPADSAPKSYL